MRRSFGMALVLGAALAAPAFGQTAAEALKVVPDDALGFVLVNNLEDADRQAAEVAKRFKAPLPGSLLEQVKKDLGIGAGLDAKGSLVLVALPPGADGEKPVGLAFVPVTDFDAFLKGRDAKADGGLAELEFANGKRFVAAKHGSYAVLTETENRAALQKALKPGKGGAGLKAVEAWLGENHASAVITTNGVKLLAAKVREGIAKAKDKQGEVPPEAEQFLKAWLEGAEKFLKNVETDVSHFGLGVKADRAGNLSVSTRAVFAPGSGFAKAGAAAKAPGANPLAGLPDVPYVMAFGGSLPGNLMQGAINLSSQMLVELAKKEEVPEDKIKQLQTSFEGMTKGMRGFAMAVGVGKEKEGLFQSTAGVYKVDDADEYLKHYESSMRTINDVFKGVKVPGAPNYQLKRTEVEGKPALVVTTDLGIDGGDPLQGKVLEAMFGPDGKMVITMVKADPHTVLMRYSGPDDAKELLRAAGAKPGGLAKEKDLAKTTELLPKGSQWLFFLNPRGTVELANRAISNFLPGGEGAGFRLPEFPPSPPIGMGVRMSEAGLEWTTVIPAATQEGLGGYVQQLMRLKGTVSLPSER